DVTFTPTSTGLVTGDLTFTHNASGSPTTYSLQGTGVAAGFGISPVSLDFGNVAIGSTGTLQVTVSNTGTSDLVIANITSSDVQFTFLPNTFPIIIVAGGNQIVDVTFTPTSTGLVTGDLTFTHNASGSPTTYSLQGTGIDAIEANINVVNLINVITGSTINLPITVTNNGIAPLLVEANISVGSNWNIVPDTVTIPAGGNFIFTLTFVAPALPNTYTGTLVFSSISVPSLTIDLSATVVSEAGLLFESDSIYRLEDNSYMDVMQLKNLTDTLHALQFRLQVNKEVNDNVILTFQNMQKGSDVSDSSWVLVYNIERGPITPNGASVDEVFVLLYNLNQGVGLLPGDHNELFRINYRVADLPALQDSIKSTIKITHAEASTFEGLPITITPSRDLLTIIGRNRITWRGDVNSDGCIDILDLIMIVDHIVNLDSLNVTELFRADIAPWLPGNPLPTPDGIVNVQELSLIQNIILTGIFPDGTPLGPCTYEMLPKLNDDQEAMVTFYINKEGISVSINSEVGIRAAQIEFGNISNEPGSLVIGTDLGQGYFHYVNSKQLLRTLLYDPLGMEHLEPGEHLMADMPFALKNPEKVTVENIILVDVNRQKLTKIQVEIVLGSTTVPVDYMLYQNYPNPFNPSTTIEFSLPEDVSNAKLSIYNALGEKVAELVNTSLSAGVYQYQWNASNVATGMYIYELRTDKFVSVKKMVLVK
ncbi:MAG: choice-of-anchor D domain-containing protein, partial [Ignavibacteriaceae bacterium]|nr:choice-of-anchor D domain-containing protein [Ignavibacteriaceae bacterium]